MKVYRVMPDSFCLENCSSQNSRSIFEDIYYKMGYVSFGENPVRHSYNTIFKKLSIEERNYGKYFFLFLEDALQKGEILLSAFHNIYPVNRFLIVEYDMPDDLVLKYLGSGDYSRSSYKDLVAECFIPKSDLENDSIPSLEILDDKKLYGLNRAFTDSLRGTSYTEGAAHFMAEYYKELYGVSDLQGLFNNLDVLRSNFAGNYIYDSYMRTQISTIKSPFITGKVIGIDTRIDNLGQVTESLEPWGKRFDSLREQEKFKNELIYYASQDTEVASSKARSLLKKKKYIKK